MSKKTGKSNKIFNPTFDAQVKNTDESDEILNRMFDVQVQNARITRSMAGKCAPCGTRREWDSVTAVCAPLFSSASKK